MRIRKRPRQARSKEMVEAILQAAAEVFADLGYARTTTNKIAERAGVSVGSLYQYFPDKDSLLGVLLDRHHADVQAIVAAALARLADPSVALEDGLRRFVMDLVSLHRSNPALTRALSTEILRQSPATDRRPGRDAGAMTRRVRDVLRGRPDVREGNHLAMAAVVAQTSEQLTRWLVHDTPQGIDRVDLGEEVVDLLVRYLGPDPASSRRPAPRGRGNRR